MVFLVIALAMIGASVLVVTSRNLVHAALMLVVALAGSAALFLMLGAEFVAWTVVLVYIGAVVVLFLFGIMITRAPLRRDPVPLDHKRRWPALLVAAGRSSPPWPTPRPPSAARGRRDPPTEWPGPATSATCSSTAS